MILILTLIIVLLTFVSTVLGFFVYRLGNIIPTLEEQVEESLDIIDASYSRITEISKIPVVSDEPVVKQLLAEIQDCRNSLLLIANKITQFSTGDDENDNNE